MTIDSLLQQCREKFGGRPREFSWWDRYGYLHIKKPFWLWTDEEDPLYELVEQRDEIFRLGVVEWGYVVQANNALFEHGKGNHPADFVYYEPGSGWQDTGHLEELVRTIYDLKHVPVNEADLAELSQHMKDDVDRASGIKIPASINGGRRCLLTTSFINRQHVPAKMLCNGLLPIVVSEAEPSKVLPLPERYWPTEFREWWLSGHGDESHYAEAPWYNRLWGGIAAGLFGLVLGWIGVQIIIAVVNAGESFDPLTIGMIAVPLLGAAWLLVLSWRMFTGRGRKSDRGLVGPWTLLTFSLAIIALGVFALYSMGTQFELKTALGGLIIVALGARGVWLAIKRLRAKNMSH